MCNITHYKLGDEINFSHISDSKFKTTNISFSMFYPIDENFVSANALLPNLLCHSCKKYPSLMLISQKLDELYGASISTSVSKIGDMQVITISSQSIATKFVPNGNDNILNLAKILCDIIFDANVEEKKFIDENLNQEKRQLKEEIISEMNDKRIFARQRCIEEMCKNEKFSINSIGTIEGADKLTGEAVFKAWRNLLETAKIKIIMAGFGPHEKVLEEFKNHFSKINRHDINQYSCAVSEAKKPVKKIVETKKIAQCKLVIGLRIKNKNEKVNSTAMQVMNALFGGTPQSKLFVNVREKLSLCYYCSSKYFKQNKIMIIESGVESKNSQKASDKILEQLEDIKIGNFSETELSQTKLYLIQQVEKTEDSLTAMQSWYLAQSIEKNIMTPSEYINAIKSISREDIIAASKQLDVDTIYTLTGEEK